MRRECRHTAHNTGLNGSRHGTVGQALTELALVLPLLALIFMGSLDLGRAYHTQVALANAARVGIVYAQEVVTPYELGACSSTVPCTHLPVSDVISKVMGEAQGGITQGQMTVKVCLPSRTPQVCLTKTGTGSTTITTTTSTGSTTTPTTGEQYLGSNEDITITVSAPFYPLTPFVHAATISATVYGHTFDFSG